MKNLILVLFISFSHLTINGQVVIKKNGGESRTENSLIMEGLRVDNFKANDLEYGDIKGSPYLEKESLRGYLIMIDEKKTETVTLQYDIYSNEFFHINNKGEEIVIDIKLIRELIMQGKEEAYVFKRINPRKPLKFYEVLYESDGLDIFNDLQVNFYEGKDQGIAKIDPRFSRDNNYYVQLKGKDVKKIKLKKKDVYKLFSKEEQKRMDALSKELNLKLKKSKDFKKLFDAMKG